jgi:glycosyltransferase involved in cell wall biosynthesis
MKVSVVFTTYNSVAWLEKVLVGFEQQSYKDFEVVIADDGSKEETRHFIEQYKSQSKLNILHVWHPDDGFRKCQIMNKAVAASSGDYFIFTDGDCIPRRDFVEVHVNQARPGYFLSGGYFKLPMETSKAITNQDIEQQHCFNVDWLVNNGLKKTYKTMKLSASGWKAKLLNTITPTNASWNGHNASCWREDMLSTNGYDERMQYGGQDREFGERLMNMGIKPVQIRYSAVCVHLDHKRGYIIPELVENNRKIRKHTRSAKIKRTPAGIAENQEITLRSADQRLNQIIPT